MPHRSDKGSLASREKGLGNYHEATYIDKILYSAMERNIVVLLGYREIFLFICFARKITEHSFNHVIIVIRDLPVA